MAIGCRSQMSDFTKEQYIGVIQMLEIFQCAGRLPVDRESSTFGICRARSASFYVRPLA